MAPESSLGDEQDNILEIKDLEEHVNHFSTEILKGADYSEPLRQRESSIRTTLARYSDNDDKILNTYAKDVGSSGLRVYLQFCQWAKYERQGFFPSSTWQTNSAWWPIRSSTRSVSCTTADLSPYGLALVAWAVPGSISPWSPQMTFPGVIAWLKRRM